MLTIDFAEKLPFHETSMRLSRLARIEGKLNPLMSIFAGTLRNLQSLHELNATLRKEQQVAHDSGHRMHEALWNLERSFFAYRDNLQAILLRLQNCSEYASPPFLAFVSSSNSACLPAEECN